MGSALEGVKHMTVPVAAPAQACQLGNMELKRGALPSRLFWTTYRGMTVLGVAGAVAGTTLGTAMILFRRAIEPWMPLIINLVLHFASRGKGGHLTYGPAAYPWIVGWVYGMGALWVGIVALSACLKPSSDRRVDAYLMRKQALDTSYVSSLKPPQAPGPL